MSKALGVSERLGLERYVSQQIYYSLQARDAEYEIVPACLDQGVGILVWSPLAGGLLSGKYRRGQEGPEGARHLTDWKEPPVRDEEQTYDVIEAAGGDRRGHGVSAAQVALAWLLGRPGVSSLVDRRAHGGAARRQPRRRRARAVGRGARPARRAQRSPADLSALAPGQDRGRPARAGRPRLAGAASRLRRHPGRSSAHTSISSVALGPSAPTTRQPRRTSDRRRPVSESTVAVKRRTPTAAARRASRRDQVAADALALAGSTHLGRDVGRVRVVAQAHEARRSRRAPRAVEGEERDVVVRRRSRRGTRARAAPAAASGRGSAGSASAGSGAACSASSSGSSAGPRSRTAEARAVTGRGGGERPFAGGGKKIERSVE